MRCCFYGFQARLQYMESGSHRLMAAVNTKHQGPYLNAIVGDGG